MYVELYNINNCPKKYIAYDVYYIKGCGYLYYESGGRHYGFSASNCDINYDLPSCPNKTNLGSGGSYTYHGPCRRFAGSIFDRADCPVYGSRYFSRYESLGGEAGDFYVIGGMARVSEYLHCGRVSISNDNTPSCNKRNYTSACSCVMWN